MLHGAVVVALVRRHTRSAGMLWEIEVRGKRFVFVAGAEVRQDVRLLGADVGLSVVRSVGME